MIVRYPRSLEGIRSRASITTGDIQEPKRLDGLFDQNPVQLTVSLAMVQKIVLHELAIELPLLLNSATSGSSGIVPVESWWRILITVESWPQAYRVMKRDASCKSGRINAKMILLNDAFFCDLVDKVSR